MITIINGHPHSGKSQFVDYCHEVSKPGVVLEYSTVDFVKELAADCGWDGTKNAKNRKFFSDLKDLLTEWNDVPFKKSKEFIDAVHTFAQGDIMVFIHCREPQEIQKFVDHYGKDQCHTLRIQRPSVDGDDQSNHADAQVDEYDYDLTIVNDGTLDQLKETAIIYMKNHLGEKVLK